LITAIVCTLINHSDDCKVRARLQWRQAQAAHAAKAAQAAHAQSAGEGNGTVSLEGLDEASAVSRLERVLTKDSFNRMRVIGQFNLGFIIASLGEEDQADGSGAVGAADAAGGVGGVGGVGGAGSRRGLFILDQHACDEKFNFERLQRDTVIHEQVGT
jgi:DNA mismatch repair protein PMS2